MASADLAIQAAIYAALVADSDILTAVSVDGTAAKARLYDETPTDDEGKYPFIALGESRMTPRRAGSDFYSFDIESTVSVFSRADSSATHKGSIDGKNIAEAVRLAIAVDGALTATGWRIKLNKWDSTTTRRADDGVTYRTDVVITTNLQSES